MKTDMRIQTGRWCAAALWLLLAPLTAAAHTDVSLAGSNFEIDSDANLKLDHAVPSIDWATVTEVRRTEDYSGALDDAFGQGSKADSPVPSVVTGSIPPNKSDLDTFGLYFENNGLASRFLHLFWTRVQDPSGSTNMDFEFNQSNVLSANGVTPVRTAGDLLIQYDLDNGGVTPHLFLSFWRDGTETPPATASDCEASNKLPCWGEKVSLAGVASGSINTSAIPGADSDGLGSLDPRTFGEASIDFVALTSGSPGQCLSFGSAYLKSRSSAEFNSSLKDFIAPITAQVSNCGSIKISKQDDTGLMMGGVRFFVYVDNSPFGGSYDPKPGGEDETTVAYQCTTSSADGEGKGTCQITGVLAGRYWVVEDSSTAPAGHDIPNPQAIEVAAGGSEVELTFTNVRQPASIMITKTDDDTPPVPLQGAVFTLYDDKGTPGVFEPGTDTSTGKTCQTNASGVCSISNILPPGNYCLDETTVPAGHGKSSSLPDCFTLALNQSKSVTYANPRSPASVQISKTDNASPANPLAGAVFTLYDDKGIAGTFEPGTDTSTGKTCVTNASGTCTISNILPPGNYCLDETTVPAGYSKASAACFSLSLGQNYVAATFVNPRLTGAIKITKTRKHAAADSPDSDPHAGVKFTVTGGELAAQGIEVTTDAGGEACLAGLLLSSLPGIGDYTVTETVPDNYVADGSTAKAVTVSAAGACGSGSEANVSFGNTPLTDLTVSVDSLVDGGTKSTITCIVKDGAGIGSVSPAQEDPSITIEDLQPGTYVCEIYIDP